MAKKRVNITFYNYLYDFIFDFSEKRGNNLTYSLIECITSLSNKFIDSYAEDKFLKASKNNSVVAVKGTTKPKMIGFSNEEYAIVLRQADNRNQSLSQYVNLALSAAMNYYKEQIKSEFSKSQSEIIIDSKDINVNIINSDNESDVEDDIDDDTDENDEISNNNLKDDDIIVINEENSILKSESIIGMPENKDKLTVFKSELMYSLISKGCNLTTLKLFDVILGRLNPMDPQKNTVVFSKKELEEASNIKRITREQMDNYLKQFMKTIEYSDGRQTLLVNLFSKGYTADCPRQSWKAVISCTRDAGLFFQLSNYAKYPLSDIIHLTSIHQYTLFQYFIFNIRFGTPKWTVDVERLKEIMDCKSETYNKNKRFIENKLKPTIERINQYTSLNVFYKTILESGSVSRIEFDVYRKPGVFISDSDKDVLNESSFSDNKQVDEARIKFIDNYVEKIDYSDSEEITRLLDYIVDFSGNRFSEQNILSIAGAVIDKLLENDCFAVSTACDYSKAAYDVLISAEIDTKIDSPVKYIKGIIRNGHPNKDKKEWFLKEKKEDIKKDSQRFMERKFNEEELKEFLEASLMID